MREHLELALLPGEEKDSFIHSPLTRRKRTINTHAHAPIHRGSAINASLLFGPTSIQSLPNLTTGQPFLHSWLHFLGLHLEALIMAIRVKESLSLPPLGLLAFFLSGMIVSWRFCFGYFCCFFHMVMESSERGDGVTTSYGNLQFCFGRRV